MKTICMYTPTAGGGHARYTWELLTALTEHRRGYQFELVSSRDLEPAFRSDRYPVHAILPPLADRKTFSTRAAWIANRLTHYLRRERFFMNWLKSRPDIKGVHFQEWTPWLAAGMFRRIRAMGKQVFYTTHNVVPHKFPKLIPRSLMRSWIRNGSRECDGLFVHTKRLADELAQFLGECHPPIQVIPHGVWTVPDGAAPAPLDERLSWKRLLCFGAIRPNKGIDLLLRAMEHLPGYSLTIAGETDRSDYFQTEILARVRFLRERGVNVDLLDRFIPNDEVAGLFASHSAIVLPYTREFVAQSGVAFMALAYALPVVASEVGGLRDLFDEFRIGTTFAEPSPEALAAAVKALYAATPRDLIERIQAARRRYSWHETARATIAGYELADKKVTESNDCPVATTAAH